MKRLILLTLVLLSVGYTSKAQEMTRDEKLKFIAQFAYETAEKCTIFKKRPEYYVQVNKQGCRTILTVNDIPARFFTRNVGETMLYPINSRLLSSGKFNYAIEVYPLSGDSVIDSSAYVQAKLVYLEDLRDPLSDLKELANLETPDDLGEQGLPFYSDSAFFKAKLPFDHSDILRNAKDLNEVPDVEDRVFEFYNRIRQMSAEGKVVEYYEKFRADSWKIAEMGYVSENGILEVMTDDIDYVFNADLLARYDVEITKENCQLRICGYGKVALLINKAILNSALLTKYASSEEIYKERNGKTNMTDISFMAIYMPEGSEEFKILY